MCVLVGINQLGFGAMVPSLPLYAQSFGVSASAIGMAIAIYGLARFVVAVPSGQLSDRIGRRPTLAIGGVISALGNLWCAWATGYPEFIVARFVAGVGAGMIVTTGNVVLADITTPARRGRALALYQGTFIFAVGIGPFPGGLLAEHFGLTAPFIAYGFASLGATIVAWFAVTETRGFWSRGIADGQPKHVMPPFREQVRLLTGQVGFLLASMVMFTNAFVRTGGLFSIVPILITDRLAVSVSSIGFALMLGSVAGLISAYPTGWLIDRYGRKSVIVPATLLSGLAMILFCFAPTYGWFVAGTIVWGVAINVGGTAPAAYVADTAPPGMNAAAMSTYRMLGDAGYMLGPLLLGAMVDGFGAVSALLAGAALMTLAGILFGLFARESYKGRAG
jgi:MFS transporter, DHA1 family, multidrug resistance protein